MNANTSLHKLLEAPFKWIIVLGLFAWGMWTVPAGLFGPGKDLIPGDLGDARVSNLVLEHFHRVGSGKERAYWDAPFLVPERDVMGRVETLLGTAPVYDVFRRAGWSRETSFQLWIAVLFALNYWAAWSALRLWGGTPVTAACGAFIYAFGIHQVGQLNQAQVHPRFMLPIALLCWWRAWQGEGSRWAWLAMLATVYQFWCSFEVGVVLVVGVLLLLVARSVMPHNRSWRSRFRDRRTWPGIFGIAALGALLLVPLLDHYLGARANMGHHAYDEVSHRIPRITSHFLTHPGAISWRDLGMTEERVFPEWWYHQHFMGATAWFGVLLTAWSSWRRSMEPSWRAGSRVILLAFSLLFLICLQVGAYSAYRLVHALPVVGMLRSVDRFILLQAFLFALMLARGARTLDRGAWSGLAVAVVLPLVTALDQRIDTSTIRSFDKYSSEREVRNIARYIDERCGPSCAAIAWCPVLPPTPSSQLFERVVREQVSVMLAAQESGTPTVNGYFLYLPDAFMPFFDRMDSSSLADWTKRHRATVPEITSIGNVGEVFIRQERGSLGVWGGAHVVVGQGVDGMLGVQRTAPALATSFAMVHARDGRVALMASNGLFVSADLSEGDLALRANAPVAGDFCLFMPQAAGDGGFVLRADNGKFVSSNGEGALYAWSDRADGGTIFFLGPLPEGVH